MHRVVGRFGYYSPIVYKIHMLDNWFEWKQSVYMRWKHWKFVNIRRWFIKHKLHRRRCSECHILTDYYGYEGIYDMCTDCFHEAHPY